MLWNTTKTKQQTLLSNNFFFQNTEKKYGYYSLSVVHVCQPCIL